MNLTDTASVFRGGALAFLLSAILALPASAASPEAEANSRLLDQVEPRLKAIYESDEFRMRSFNATWLPDGSGYLKLETPDGASGPEIARYESASGNRTVVAGEELLVPGTSERLRIHDFVCSPTGKRLLLHTDEMRWVAAITGSMNWSPVTCVR